VRRITRGRFNKTGEKIMKRLIVGMVFVLAVFLCVPGISRAQGSEIQTGGKVCSNPSSPCVKILDKDVRVFSDSDLSFKLPSKLKWGNNYNSADFYAIVLKSRPAVSDKDRASKSVCSEGYYSDQDRKELQMMFPKHKVFTSRTGCAGYQIGYTNAYDGKEPTEFAAVHAGNTEAEAQNFLKQVRAKKEFSDATVRKMQVVYGYGD
jgi:hypothetical protein